LSPLRGLVTPLAVTGDSHDNRGVRPLRQADAQVQKSRSFSRSARTASRCRIPPRRRSVCLSDTASPQIRMQMPGRCPVPPKWQRHAGHQVSAQTAKTPGFDYARPRPGGPRRGQARPWNIRLRQPASPSRAWRHLRCRKGKGRNSATPRIVKFDKNAEVHQDVRPLGR